MVKRLSLMLLLTASPALAAPQPMTRNEIMNLAVSGVDYSYWWGHGCWRSDGEQPGSCSGSCPDCTHSGSYGADCSGFASKVWQVPSPSPIENDAHPYSTREFRYDTTHWSQVAREEALRGDCFVYRNSSNTGGHIVVYESGDPWGNLWTYEARGCSYGIVHNLRSLSSSYVAIRRVNLDGSASDGTIKGVVYVDYGQGTADMTERVPGARVVCGDAGETLARPEDAFWSFSVPAGAYTVSVSADGFETAARECGAQSGGETWCSVGLPPACQKGCGGRVCGPDPLCGLSCGTCPQGQDCNPQGTCEPADCVRQCNGLECGPDPLCDKSCGQCAPGDACNINGRCLPEGTFCEKDCGGVECGRDPVCGSLCGICDPELICGAAGSCVAVDPSMGKLHGHVVALDPNDPEPDLVRAPSVGGASVRTGTGLSTKAFENGYYELLVPPGEHQLSARAPGYLEGTAACSVAAGGHTECFLPVYEELEADVVAGGCGCNSSGAPGSPALLALLLLLRRRVHYRTARV